MTKRRIRLLIAGIIALLLLSSFSSFTIIRDGIRIDRALKQYDDHLIFRETIVEFILLSERSKQLSISWVYLIANEEYKKELNELQVVQYPELKSRIEKLMPSWDENQRTEMILSFGEFESLIKTQQRVFMSRLQTVENYEDPTVKYLSETELESDVLPNIESILGRLRDIEKNYNTATTEALAESRSVISISDMRSLIVSITMFASGVIGLVITIGASKQSSE